MARRADQRLTSPSSVLSNAEIADRLGGLAQILSANKENPYKVRAYHRAATRIRNLSESLDEMVRGEQDLTQFAGIGEAIASAIREIVRTGTLAKLEKLRGSASPAVAELSRYPRLDPKRMLRVYKKLGISSVGELRHSFENGELEKIFGSRMAQHVRHGLTVSQAMLLYHADALHEAILSFLLSSCEVDRAEAVGDYRRRVEVIEELVFVIETDNFAHVVERMQSYGGRTPMVESRADRASFALSAGIMLTLQHADNRDWGFHLIVGTGSKAHLQKLTALTAPLAELKHQRLPSEQVFFDRFNLEYIAPELREGLDEVEQSKSHDLPVLVTAADIRGDLHAHSLSSDGSDSIEDMAEAASGRGYEYIGVTDHSQSLKIAGGVSTEALWTQIRLIDKLNSRLRGFRILKSSEVDILADGTLDYPDNLLKELDYTVCSIHSRFALGKEAQTERLMRAMDNRYFSILGHATGRLLLKRPGYEIDIERIIQHARQRGCFFEINSSPDRLDLGAEHVRIAAKAGVKIAISTDSHSTGELRLVKYGLDQARRAGLTKSDVVNTRPLESLSALLRR